MRKLLRSPFVWIAIGAAGTLAPMLLPSGIGWPVSLLAFCAFSVAATVACARGERWWLHTAPTAFAWVAIFVAVGETPGVKTIRELATVYLLPMTIYPVAVAISGASRAARRRKRREQPPLVHI